MSKPTMASPWTELPGDSATMRQLKAMRRAMDEAPDEHERGRIGGQLTEWIDSISEPGATPAGGEG